MVGSRKVSRISADANSKQNESWSRPSERGLNGAVGKMVHWISFDHIKDGGRQILFDTFLFPEKGNEKGDFIKYMTEMNERKYGWLPRETRGHLTKRKISIVGMT